jgi:2-iminoacetate synthase
VHGYHRDIERPAEETTGQFQVEDHRTTDEMLASVCEAGYLPSFCTACYRQGRTGDRFMALAKTGEIQNICQPNAILTFKEFLLDYASERTKKVGEEALLRHLESVPNVKLRDEVRRRLERLEAGERDLYF